MNKETKTPVRTTVRDLMSGDVLSTGETVVTVYRDLRTPAHSRVVIARRPDGTKWGRQWRAQTALTVLRNS